MIGPDSGQIIVTLDHTSYLAIVEPGGCFLPDRPRRLSEITDAHEKTLLVIEGARDRTVPWMCPRDADAAQLLGVEPRTILNHNRGFNSLFVDGSVRFLDAADSAAGRRARITVAGGDDREAED